MTMDLFELAEHGLLPADFDRWGYAEPNDPHQWTVAHEAAVMGTLPESFSLWELADASGQTVAHVAARHGNLPLNFNRWELEDDHGWTVAHEAAAHGHLPPDFRHLDWTDDAGYTVSAVQKRPLWKRILPWHPEPVEPPEPPETFFPEVEL